MTGVCHFKGTFFQSDKICVWSELGTTPKVGVGNWAEAGRKCLVKLEIC